MSEGEFKKRMVQRVKDLMSDSYVDLETVGARRDANADFEEWLDEAKKEFPLLTPKLERDFPKLWALRLSEPLRLSEQRVDWFWKWFGDAK